MKRMLLPTVCICFLCGRLIDYVSVELFQGPLFCSINVRVYFCDGAVLITIVSYYHMKSGRVISPGMLFFLKIILALQCLLWLHINFRIICSSSVKNVIDILTDIATNLYIALDNPDFLTIFIFPIHKHGIYFHLFISASIY